PVRPSSPVTRVNVSPMRRVSTLSSLPVVVAAQPSATRMVVCGKANVAATDAVGAGFTKKRTALHHARRALEPSRKTALNSPSTRAVAKGRTFRKVVKALGKKPSATVKLIVLIPVVERIVRVAV